MIRLPFPDNDITLEDAIYIAEIQEKLRALELQENGESGVPVDGIYGPKTTEAVEKFQQRYGLPVTGIVDRNTYYKLVEEYNRFLGRYVTAVPIQGFLPMDGSIIRPGETGNAVSFLNIMLATIATVFRNVPITEKNDRYSDTTEAAVRALQTVFNLPVTGLVNRQTWNRITDLYNDLVQDLYMQNNAIF